jgi:hypothetical protein
MNLLFAAIFSTVLILINRYTYNRGYCDALDYAEKEFLKILDKEEARLQARTQWRKE